jgi:hypothetical protein
MEIDVSWRVLRCLEIFGKKYCEIWLGDDAVVLMC